MLLGTELSTSVTLGDRDMERAQARQPTAFHHFTPVDVRWQVTNKSRLVPGVGLEPTLPLEKGGLRPPEIVRQVRFRPSDAVCSAASSAPSVQCAHVMRSVVEFCAHRVYMGMASSSAPGRLPQDQSDTCNEAARSISRAAKATDSAGNTHSGSSVLARHPPKRFS